MFALQTLKFYEDPYRIDCNHVLSKTSLEDLFQEVKKLSS